MAVLALAVNSNSLGTGCKKKKKSKTLVWTEFTRVRVCVISPPVRHTPSSYKAISPPTPFPQGLLTPGWGGGAEDDITQLSSFLFVYLHPFHSFSSIPLPLCTLGLTFPKPSDAAVFIKGICCKITTPAKRVRDYLVLPPTPTPHSPTLITPSHFHPCWSSSRPTAG